MAARIDFDPAVGLFIYDDDVLTVSIRVDGPAYFRGPFPTP